MIVAKSGLWEICTPTKCGTYSIEATLTQRQDAAFKMVPRHRHESMLPKATRFMTARHPLDRWCSMYWFIKQHGEGHIWMGEFAEKPIDDFVREWASRDYPMWTWNLSRYVREYRPHHIYKLEDGYDSLLEHVCKIDPQVQCVSFSHKNKTRDRQSIETTMAMMSSESVDTLFDWIKPDLQLLGYA